MVTSSERSLVHPALEDIKLMNYEDREKLLLRLYSVSTLDLKFYIYLA